MNALDKKINNMALEILRAQGKTESEVESAFNQLRFVVDRRINSRAEIIGLLKMAKASA